MPNDDTSDLFTYIKEIIDSTRAGNIVWERANPTTFVWRPSDLEKGRVVLQRIDKQEIIRSVSGRPQVRINKLYVLQILQGLSGTVAMSVGGESDDNINKELAGLYGEVGASISKRGLELLKSLLPPKKQ